MKIRTRMELEEALEEELAWRLKEMRSLRIDVKAAQGDRKRMLMRAMLALSYAHWEGYITAAVSHYLSYVRGLKLRYSELATCLLALSLQGHLAGLNGTRVAGPYVDFAEFLRGSMNDRAKLPEALDDAGNLDSRILRNILRALDIPYAEFELKEKLIDERLLKTRNEIAHGESSCPPEAELLEVHEAVEALLRHLRGELSNCVQQRRFTI